MKIMIPMCPLSVNKAWAGRRFKSSYYKQFEEDVCKLLKICNKPLMGFVEIEYIFFIKNFGGTDVDNLVKPIQDIVVKRGYIEDDRKIVRMIAKKVKSNIEAVHIFINSCKI